MPWKACQIVLLIWFLGQSVSSQDQHFRVSDEESPEALSDNSSKVPDSAGSFRDAAFSPPQTFIPAPPPRTEIRPAEPAADSDIDRTYRSSGLRPSRSGVIRQRQMPPVGYRVPSSDVPFRGSTDAGNHVGKNPAAPPVWNQQRNPVVTDSRISGSRVGRIAASGSHWVPVRIDLDTMLNQFDSRTLGDITVIPGPYTVRHGPDFQFFQVDLLPSPRADQWQAGGSTGFEFKSNGQHWLGRQTVYGADSDWGYRLGYSHRTGNDYRTGGNQPDEIAASFNSRSFDLALGRDLSSDRHLEFHVLRLDQTNVELPGQAFDIDALVTNGFEAEYINEDSEIFDQESVAVWYNDTNFQGNSQGSGKRRILTFLDDVSYVGFTSVRGFSTGYRYEGRVQLDHLGEFLLGTDFRLIRQQLDEFSQGQIGIATFDGNSPIPRSESINPGLFAEYTAGSLDEWRLKVGGRLDLAATRVIADSAKLADVTLAHQPLAAVLGTSDFDQMFFLGSLFLAGEHQFNEHTIGFLGAGYAMRPPTLTELYAAQPFMFLLQNGLNAVTGDPLLKEERLWQVDVGLRFHSERARGSARVFHSWINNYITFRNNGTVIAGGSVQQVDLRYINTRLATLTGAELQAEYDFASMLTGFGTLACVYGEDWTRAGGGSEALPMIPPLRGRVGARLHQPGPEPEWGIELSSQITAAQNRVANTLLEHQTPGYTTYDLRAFWEPTQHLSLFTGIENLTSKSYRDHFDYRAPDGIRIRQPGFNFYVGAEARY